MSNHKYAFDSQSEKKEEIEAHLREMRRADPGKIPLVFELFEFPPKYFFCNFCSLVQFLTGEGSIGGLGISSFTIIFVL